MKRLILGLMVLLMPGAVLADPNAQYNILTTIPSYSGCSDPAFDWIDEGECADLVSSQTFPMYVWIVVSDGDGFPDGIGGAQFGIEHSVAPGGGWALCTGGQEIQEGGWPASGTGNAVTWPGGCYDPVGSNAKIGFFAYVPPGDPPGSFAITPDPRNGLAIYSSCDQVSTEICADNLATDADLTDGVSPDCDASALGAVNAASGLTATEDECGVIHLEWTDNSDNEVGFLIMVAGAEWFTTIADTTSHDDTEHVDGIGHLYQVIAVGECGVADPSNTVTGTGLPKPLPVSDVDATDDQCGMVTITWTDNSDDETGMLVYRDDDKIGWQPPGTMTFDDTGAVPGEIYEYRVFSAIAGCNSDSADANAGGIPLPDSAYNCSATDGLCDLPVTITWDRGSGESGFRILRDGDEIGMAAENTGTYDDDTGTAGVQYDYSVVAVGNCGDAAASNTDTGWWDTQPTAASGCAASDDLCNVVTVTWTDNSTTETGFEIQRDGAPYDTTDADATSYNDTDVVESTVYTYGVVALGDCGNAAVSNTDTGQTGAGAPAAASDCVASDDLCDQICVSWTDNSTDETMFVILRGGARVDSVGADSTMYCDMTVTADQIYSYSVIAKNECGEPAASNSDDGMAYGDVPAAATACAASDTLCDNVHIVWTDNSTDEAGFIIERNGTPIDTTAADATEYTDITAEESMTYTYGVVAYNDCGEAVACEDDGSELPLLAAPTLTMPADDATCVPVSGTMEWEAVAGALRYWVEIGTTCGDGVPDTSSTTSYSYSGLTPNTTYHWHVATDNACMETGNWNAECFTFTTAPDLAAPTPDDAIVDGTTVTFGWDPVDKAESYWLTVATACHADSVAVEYEVTGTDTTVDLATYDIGDFGWWVSAFACGTHGPDSDCNTATPVVLQFFGATSVSGGILIEWRTGAELNVAGFNLYRRPTTGGQQTKVNTKIIQPGHFSYRYTDRGAETDLEYVYQLTEVTTDDRELPLGEVIVRSVFIPTEFALKRAVPNPFNPTTTLEFWVPQAERVVLDIYSPSGRLIRRLVDERLEPGVHNVMWNGRNDGGNIVASGTYFALLKADGVRNVTRLTLLK